ncbi:hypothetical protein [Flavobacterium sp.]|uniref:hypothetical protein n=1 Tax=Flavobacterium sp. TaxID=239 RepID=UPI002616FAE0|nr:hypothetical protein [Flavobacterium sp.]
MEKKFSILLLKRKSLSESCIWSFASGFTMSFHFDETTFKCDPAVRSDCFPA